MPQTPEEKTIELNCTQCGLKITHDVPNQCSKFNRQFTTYNCVGYEPIKQKNRNQISRTAISNCLSGRSKNAGGLIFKYLT